MAVQVDDDPVKLHAATWKVKHDTAGKKKSILHILGWPAGPFFSPS